MAYQERIGMPALMVTGCTGAWGNTKRMFRSCTPSSGTMGTKSLPSAPRPCNQITENCASFLGLSSIHSKSSDMVDFPLLLCLRLDCEGALECVLSYLGPKRFFFRVLKIGRAKRLTPVTLPFPNASFA